MVRTFHVHPGDFGLKKTSLRGDHRRRRRAPTPGSSSRRFAARRGRCATSCCSMPAPACSWPATPPPSARASRAAADAIDSGRAIATLDSLIRSGQPGAAGMSVETSDLLAAIVAATRTRVLQAAARAPLASLERRAADAPPPRGFRRALARRRRPVIAECKRRSPSRGVLRADYDPAAHRAALRGGGSRRDLGADRADFLRRRPGHLEAVRRAVDVPLLRKDFILDRLPAARGAGRRRRRGAADRRGAGRRALERCWPRRARAWARRARRGPRRGGARTRGRRRRRPHRRQQPQSPHARGGRGRVGPAGGADAGGASSPVAESGLKTGGRPSTPARPSAIAPSSSASDS